MIVKPDMVKPKTVTPETVTLGMIVKPDMVKPRMVTTEMVTHEMIVKPEMVNPEMVTPEIANRFDRKESLEADLVRSGYHRVVSEEVVAGTEIPGGGGRGTLHLSLHCHHQKDSRIKMDNFVSPFKVLIIARAQSRDSAHKPQFLKREESRNRIEPNA